MYASISSGQVQAGKLDEYLQLFRDTIAPAAKRLKGFREVYVLADSATNKVQTIAFYETQADAQAVQTNGDFQRLLAMLGDTLVRDSVLRTGYEVSFHGVSLQGTTPGVPHSNTARSAC